MIKVFIRDHHGGIAPFMIGAFFFSLIIVGVGFDFEQALSGRRAVKNLVDSAALAGGIACRAEHIRTKASASTLPAGVISVARQAAEGKMQNGGLNIGSARIRQGTTPTYTITHQPPAGADEPNRCRVNLKYEGESSNIVSRLIGQPKYYFSGETTVDANLEESIHLEIDFLIDASGSMSTITNPSDYSRIMSITRTNEAAHSTHNGGCIFLCHSRRGLLSGEASQNAIAQYPSIRQFVYKGTSTSGTQTGEKLVMLDDVLKAANIRLKSDDVFSSVETMISSLRSHATASRQKVAFHRFSKGIQTFIPSSGNGLSDLTSVSLNLKDFDYLIPNGGGGEAVPSFFPWPAPSVPITDPVFGDPSAANGADSVPYSTVQNLDHNVVGTHSPETEIPGAVSEVLAKIDSRGKPSKKVRQVVVLVTDGVTTSPGGNSSGEAIPLGTCDALKRKGIVVMVVHTYYRFQSGNPASGNLMTKLGGGSEDGINKGTLHDTLADCATPRAQASPTGESSYYFPASDQSQLSQAFQDLLKALLELPSNDTPVKVVE